MALFTQVNPTNNNFQQSSQQPIRSGPIQQRLQQIRKSQSQLNVSARSDWETKRFRVSQEDEFVTLQMLKALNSQYNLNHMVQFENGEFIIQAPKDEFEEFELEVQKLFSEYLDRYVKKDLDLLQQKVSYFTQNLVREQAIYENNENCRITINQPNNIRQHNQQAKVVLQINYQDKQFKIIEGDIQKLRSEAVVNTSNEQLQFGHPSMQTGVCKKIQHLGGICYEKACKDFINIKQQLYFGDVFAHHHDSVLIKYILTIATPYYEQGSKTQQDLNIISQNIEAIFKKADQMKIKELTFPIIGGGTSGFQFNSAASNVTRSVIEGLYSLKTSVTVANIIEIDPDKIQKLIQVANDIIKEKPKRQVQYQWQWWDGREFSDYDDAEINEQIDIAYENFYYDNNKDNIRLIFPYSKQPGTHRANLNDKTLIDYAYNEVQKITLKSDQGRATYFFDNQPVHAELNEFIFTQKARGIQEFEIFYKRHQMIFRSDKIYQINLDTNYRRNVQTVPYLKLYVQEGKCTLNGKQYQLLCDQQAPKVTLTLEVIDMHNFNRINIDIKQFIRSAFVQMIIDIPMILDSDLNTLKELIQSDSLEINGQIAVNQQVKILVNRQAKQNILNHISTSVLRQQIMDIIQVQQSNAITYPNEWVQQQVNFLKVELPTNSNEFSKIAKLFAESDNGRIYKIYRIQNKILWQNYQQDKQKLINRYQNQNYQLTAQEMEMYVWHGVRNSHPSIIYTSDIDAFDSSYSRDDCLWGPGIYFAERARYSREYSYKLSKQDDAKYEGKNVMLCCLLSTGNQILSQVGQKNVRLTQI